MIIAMIKRGLPRALRADPRSPLPEGQAAALALPLALGKGPNPAQEDRRWLALGA
ncbi:hypothetical protein RMHFA_05678 [Roseomonas mucosa]|nr:hypothetical protein RMHFA_05678 [Roseomonas mucosa]